MYLIGRGRYARETYPQSRAAGEFTPVRGFTTGTFAGNLGAVTPALVPGTPILAFNLTPNQSGLIECAADILVSPSVADTLTYIAQLVEGGSATGGVSLGTNVLGGNNATPLVIPAGGVTIAQFQESTVASIAQRSSTLAFHANATVGAACAVVVYAISTSGASVWTVSVNASAIEQQN